MYSWASLRVWQNTIGTVGQLICNSASPSIDRGRTSIGEREEFRVAVLNYYGGAWQPGEFGELILQLAIEHPGSKVRQRFSLDRGDEVITPLSP